MHRTSAVFKSFERKRKSKQINTVCGYQNKTCTLEYSRKIKDVVFVLFQIIDCFRPKA